MAVKLWAERYEAATDRIEARLDKTGDCWLWPGGTSGNGYGQLTTLTGDERKQTTIKVHRAMYERHVGPIPEGMELDHLCKVKRCANPAHLEPVTHLENVQRWMTSITACPQGHEYTESNTYMQGATRVCRQCRRIQDRLRPERR